MRNAAQFKKNAQIRKELSLIVENYLVEEGYGHVERPRNKNWQFGLMNAK
jgi:hypothetical protein